eukprot:755161-Hanusia_phi.AAC.4
MLSQLYRAHTIRDLNAVRAMKPDVMCEADWGNRFQGRILLMRGWMRRKRVAIIPRELNGISGVYSEVTSPPPPPPPPPYRIC